MVAVKEDMPVTITAATKRGMPSTLKQSASHKVPYLSMMIDAVASNRV
ncbi:MAG: hypothetical protein IH948_03450 [Bacteroidetes bacterium]|nr:hypothetical protein [Bacteroidota bacterium]